MLGKVKLVQHSYVSCLFLKDKKLFLQSPTHVFLLFLPVLHEQEKVKLPHHCQPSSALRNVQCIQYLHSWGTFRACKEEKHSDIMQATL